MSVFLTGVSALPTSVSATFVGAESVLSLDLSGDYTVYPCQQCIELYRKGLCTLFHVCRTCGCFLAACGIDEFTYTPGGSTLD